LNLRIGRRTNPGIRCAGVSLNTEHLDTLSAMRLLAEQRSHLNLPVADPVRGGTEFEVLVSACLA
jgi:uncharacterized NAD-dependent epimerase/dehydratase family protein